MNKEDLSKNKVELFRESFIAGYKQAIDDNSISEDDLPSFVKGVLGENATHGDVSTETLFYFDEEKNTVQNNELYFIPFSQGIRNYVNEQKKDKSDYRTNELITIESKSYWALNKYYSQFADENVCNASGLKIGNKPYFLGVILVLINGTWTLFNKAFRLDMNHHHNDMVKGKQSLYSQLKNGNSDFIVSHINMIKQDKKHMLEDFTANTVDKLPHDVLDVLCKQANLIGKIAYNAETISMPPTESVNVVQAMRHGFAVCRDGELDMANELECKKIQAIMKMIDDNAPTKVKKPFKMKQGAFDNVDDLLFSKSNEQNAIEQQKEESNTEVFEEDIPF